VVIGFATSAGDTADDGNEGMSPYAKALSVRLKEPNKDITKVLGLVALDVSKKHNQNPILRTNLAYDVYLSKSNDKTSQPSTPKIITKIDSNPKPIISSKTKGITIIDGLMYQNQPFTQQDVDNYNNGKNGGRVWTWSKAKTYCKKLTINGIKNWRVPTKNELKKIMISQFPKKEYDEVITKGIMNNTFEKLYNELEKKYPKPKNSKGYAFLVKKDFLEQMPDDLNDKYSIDFWTSTKVNSYGAWHGDVKGSSVESWSKMSNHFYVMCVHDMK